MKLREENAEYLCYFVDSKTFLKNTPIPYALIKD